MTDAARDARIWLVHVMEIAVHEALDALESGAEHIRRLLDESEKLKGENVELRKADAKSTELLIGWLTTDDDVDMIIHTDRWLRERCNCENELPPCTVCETLDN